MADICGKKNIGLQSTFLFDFEQSEESGIPITQIGRNITRMRLCVEEFFEQKPSETNFMLYIGLFLRFEMFLTSKKVTNKNTFEQIKCVYMFCAYFNKK